MKATLLPPTIPNQNAVALIARIIAKKTVTNGYR
jgi:hypothetical protein